jgi:O-antigen/teichoic acid export membrane protein
VSKVRLSLLYSFAQKYATVTVGVVVTAVISRLLPPSELGVYFVSMSIIGLMQVFRDLGMANYIIQEAALSEERIRTAATLLIATSWILAVLVACSGGQVAHFYGDPRLQQMMWIGALGFLILPVGTLISAELRRDMSFAQLARANIAGALSNGLVTIGLALLGFRVFSLMWGMVASTAVFTAVLIHERPLLRIFRPTVVEWKRVMSFSGYSVATALVNEVYRSGPDLILGRVLGFGALGLYARANGLISLFNRLVLEAVDPVILPALSRSVRSGENIKAAYLLAIEHITVFYWPFLVTLALMADAVIRVLLGSQWLGAVPIARILAVAALVNFPSFLTYPFLVALGRIRDAWLMSMISVPISLAAIVLAMPYGLRAVALSSFVSLPLQQVVAQWFIGRRVGVFAGDIARAAAKSAGVTAAASIAPACSLLLSTTSFSAALSTLALGASGGFAGWVAGAVATDHPVVGEVQRVIERGSRLFREHVIGFR